MIADRADTGRWQRWSLVVGIGCLLVAAVGAWCTPAPFFRAYLAAYLFYLGIAHRVRWRC